MHRFQRFHFFHAIRTPARQEIDDHRRADLVGEDQIDAIRTRLIEAGIECSELVYHDDSEWTVSKTLHEGCFVASVYFFGPDGVLLELASWTRDLRPDDVRHAPATAADAAAYLSAAAGG